ncbi:hypothetical protein N9R79_09920 [Vibrio sp.]|nr:hypothetical protein [Vibrio sp.]
MKSLFILLMLFSNFSISKTLNEKIKDIEIQCYSCSIAAKSYIMTRHDSCNDDVKNIDLDRLALSPLFNGFAAIHVVDNGYYYDRFVAHVKKNPICDNEVEWFKRSRLSFINSISSSKGL